MAARTTMAALLLRVRNMLGDTNSGAYNFTDDTVQECLDATRNTVRYGILRPEPTLTASGIINYSDFYADVGDWEDAPATTLYGPNYAALTPATVDSITGHWVFALPNPGQTLPVYIVGNYFDRFAAAAELCERWAAQMARNYDFFTGGQRMFRSQGYKAMLAMAAQYRMQARPKFVPFNRDDEGGQMPWPMGNFDVDMW